MSSLSNAFVLLFALIAWNIIVLRVNAAFSSFSLARSIRIITKPYLSFPSVNKPSNIQLRPTHKHDVNYEGAWIPMISLDTTDDKHPLQIETFGQKFVVWKDKKHDSKNEGWSVMDDYCPHRLAPLSEGRVNPETGCIECPYHGWQFESKTGQCQLIPQLQRKHDLHLNKSYELICSLHNNFHAGKISVQSYPTHITPGILWAYLPIPGLNQTLVDTYPEAIFEKLADKDRHVVARDLPYSYDFAIENFMDVSHPPFAHHGLDGVRADASKLNISILTDLTRNDTHIQIVSTDQHVFGHPTDVKITFRSPIYFLLEKSKGNVIVFIVPVAPNQCRVFISMRSVVKGLPLPKLMVHDYVQKFLESDIWIRHQENAIFQPRNSYFIDKSQTTANASDLQMETNLLKNYNIMSTADIPVVAWRQWWKQHLSHIPYFRHWSRSDHEGDGNKRTDRFHTHSKNCKICNQAIQRATFIKKWIQPLLLSLFLFWNSLSIKNWISNQWLRTQLSSMQTAPFTKTFPILMNFLAKFQRTLDLFEIHQANIIRFVGVLGFLFLYNTMMRLAGWMEKVARGPDAPDKTSAAQLNPL